MFCNKCGNQLADNAKFCNMCGAKVGAMTNTPAPSPVIPDPAPVTPPPAPAPAPAKPVENSFFQQEQPEQNPLDPFNQQTVFAKPPVSQPSFDQPPVSQHTVDQQPVGQRPGNPPPVSKPPVNPPPVSKPPVGAPPVSKPPVGEPPVGKPPVGKPPVGVPTPPQKTAASSGAPGTMGRFGGLSAILFAIALFLISSPFLPMFGDKDYSFGALKYLNDFAKSTGQNIFSLTGDALSKGTSETVLMFVGLWVNILFEVFALIFVIVAFARLFSSGNDKSVKVLGSLRTSICFSLIGFIASFGLIIASFMQYSSAKFSNVFKQVLYVFSYVCLGVSVLGIILAFVFVGMARKENGGQAPAQNPAAVPADVPQPLPPQGQYQQPVPSQDQYSQPVSPLDPFSQPAPQQDPFMQPAPSQNQYSDFDKFDQYEQPSTYNNPFDF